jgi:hypothetical protein
MKLLAVLVSMVILLAVGVRLMFYGFVGLVSSRSNMGLELLGLIAGIICFASGIISGVLLMRQHYRI